jgi:hypothetical protein
MRQRGADHHALRQRGCLKVLEKTWYHARTYTKSSAKRSWLSRGTITGIPESPRSNLVPRTHLHKSVSEEQLAITR